MWFGKAIVHEYHQNCVLKSQRKSRKLIEKPHSIRLNSKKCCFKFNVQGTWWEIR